MSWIRENADPCYHRDMRDVFCYFLGAGASCNSLPLVSEVPNRLESFSSQLLNIGESTGLKTDQLKKATDWLLDGVKRHATIDTFAKKLLLRGDTDDLKKLKAVTSCFFVAEQAQNPVDFRYDTFLASVIPAHTASEVRFPENLRILTWNYDTQLEKAFFGFCDDDKHVANEVTFSQKVTRLNGYCGTHPPGHLGIAYRETLNQSTYKGIEAAVDLFGEYTKAPNEVAADIRFAWELDTSQIENDVNKTLSGVTTVVIIGYSFPFFNREIDRLILSAMQQVESIYIQVPEMKHKGTKERIEALGMDLELPQTVYLSNVDEFYIPFNYE